LIMTLFLGMRSFDFGVKILVSIIKLQYGKLKLERKTRQNYE